jgi:ABC-2 type transport system ATP-binding protein
VSQPSLSDVVLDCQDLCKSYGALRAVDGVSFQVANREIVGLVGPNGAGKTTIINMVLGVLEPTRGKVVIDGFDVARKRSQALERTNFAAVYAPLPGNLTVRQNLKVFGLIYGVKNLEARIDEVLAEFDLVRFARTKAGLLSSGEQTRVDLAKAMLNRPRLLLLDEPTASIDPASAREIRARIEGFARQGAGGAVLWTSHNMYEVEEVCDRVLFISRGRILLEGDPRTLRQEHGAATLEDLFVSIANESLNHAEQGA